MATWIIHLRIAEEIKSYLNVLEVPFIIGNIGPDCGEPNEDGSMFEPPVEVTHWSVGGLKRDIDSDGFFEMYLKDWATLSKKHFSFYIGYYIHLLTDREFSKQIAQPLFRMYQVDLKNNKKLLRLIKKDWYDLDHLYLREHSEFKAFKTLEGIENFENDYLPYYSSTALLRQVIYIQQFYRKGGENLERTYQYLTMQQIDVFVNKMCDIMKEKLKEKGVLKNYMKVVETVKEVEAVIQEHPISLVYFTGLACGACEVIKQKIEHILLDYPDVEAVEINGEKHPEVAAQYQVFALPLLILYVDQKESLREGRHFDLLHFKQKLQRYVALMQ